MSEAWAEGSTARWRRFRERLFAAWDQQGRTVCEVRLACCTGRREQVDHIWLLSKGGPRYDVTNCRPACAPCNRARGTAEPSPQPEPRPTSSW